MLHDRPLSVGIRVVYMNMGVMTKADAVHAAADTTLETNGVRTRGAAIG